MATREPPTLEGLTSVIHSTFATPGARWQEVLDFAMKSAAYSFPVLAVQGCWAEDLRQLLRGSGTKLSVLVGYNLGGSSIESKVAEVEKGLDAGAEMFDYLPNLGYLRSGLFGRFKGEVREILRAAKGRPVCASLELPSLSIEERISGAGLADAAGVAAVSNSGGLESSDQAKEEDVHMLRNLVSSKVKVKAAGGIRDLDGALRMLNAGADFLATSSGFQIIDELRSGTAGLPRGRGRKAGYRAP
jgi:deoxyribose-phosphate aldolase